MILSRLKLHACTRVGAAPTVLGRVWVHGAGRIVIGDRVHVDGRALPVELHAHPGGELLLGDDVHLGPGASLEALGRIRVGDRVELRASCKVLDSHFHPLQRERMRRTPPLEVVVEDDVVLGEKVIVLPGAHVTAGTRVPPGTVVRRRGPVVSLPDAAALAAEGPDTRTLAQLAREVGGLALKMARGRYLFAGARRGKRVYAGGYVRVVNAGELVLGDRVEFVGGVIPTEIVCKPSARLAIGGGTQLNHGSRIEATSGVDIGRRCMIASRVEIADRGAPIVIGDEVWLAHGSVVRPGVHIGARSVVGAGSVVTRDVPSECLALGNPARVLPLRLVAP